MASSSGVRGPPFPKPQGRKPTNHEWDEMLGQYIHNETKQPWAKGWRSTESTAQQMGRKDERKRVRDKDERNEQAALRSARALRTAARKHPPPLVTRNEFEKLAAMHRAVRRGESVGFERIQLPWTRILRRGAPFHEPSP